MLKRGSIVLSIWSGINFFLASLILLKFRLFSRTLKFLHTLRYRVQSHISGGLWRSGRNRR